MTISQLIAGVLFVAPFVWFLRGAYRDGQLKHALLCMAAVPILIGYGALIGWLAS